MEKSKSKTTIYKVKDHSVSGDVFDLIENSKYGFLETYPKPSSDTLPEYYKSEDYISHTDSKRNMFELIYHWVRTYSLRQKLKLINQVSDGKTLLDIGCGTGDFLQTAKEGKWMIYGVEPNKEARAIANSKTNNSVFDTDKLFKFETSSFDVITLWHVLEHLEHLEEQIKLYKKILKPNGTLIIAVPNYNSYDAKYYKEFWAAYDIPRHLWHFNKTSIINLFSEVSMKIIKIKPMYFDAFYISLLSEKYKTGKMNFFKGIWLGLISNLKSLETKEASSLIYVIRNAEN